MEGMRETISFYWGRIQAGRLQEMILQMRFIFGYSKRYWKEMVIITVLGLLGSSVGFLSSLVSRDLVDIVTGHETGELIKTFALMSGAAIFGVILGQVTSYFSSRISMRVDADVKGELFERFMLADWEKLAKYHTVDLLQRWGNDASQVVNTALNFLPMCINNFYRLIVAFVIVVTNDWTFAIFAMIGLPFSFIMSRRNLKRMKKRNLESMAIGAKVNGFDQEAFANVQTIKAFGLVKDYVERLHGLQNERIALSLSYSRESAIMQVLSSVVGLFVTYSCYGWGVYRVWSGAITFGTMQLFLQMSGSLTGSLSGLGGMATQLVTATTSASRVMEICDLPSEPYEDHDEVDAFLSRHQTEGVGMEVNDVAFSYERGNRVLENVSFSVAPGEIIGIVGPSGFGKTTTLRLLLALVRPEEGTVSLVSEDDSLAMSPAGRKAITYVPQGNTMFSGTIEENLRTASPEATDEEVDKALKDACAWDFVQRLPEGKCTAIMERGGGLSEGQAQRLAIARALVRDAPIMMLDEASSALDVATERTVMRNIMGGKTKRACIVTTHRPTVLSLCDRVYQIADGTCRLLSPEDIEQLITDF